MEENSLKDIRRKLEDMNKRKEEWNMERDKVEKRIRDLKENRKKGINKGERGKNSNSKIKSYRRKRGKKRGEGGRGERKRNVTINGIKEKGGVLKYGIGGA